MRRNRKHVNLKLHDICSLHILFFLSFIARHNDLKKTYSTHKRFCFVFGQNHNPAQHNHAPVAVMREVESSTPAGPTLTVLTSLKRKCCLCNYTVKWLEFHVFSGKDCKPEVPAHSPCWKPNSIGL